MITTLPKILATLACIALSTGCIRSPIAMMPSSKPLAPNGYEELGPVEEHDCAWALLGIFPVSFGNNLQSAMQDAIAQKKGGDALIQVTAESYFQHFIVVSRYCSIIQGIVVKSRPTTPTSALTPPTATAPATVPSP
jgi:hypothetical protein